jgi:S-adenosylmethionine:tRNA ribosyltransferase-isomerase
VKTELFDYRLPDDLVALHPVEDREGARLLIVPPGAAGFGHSRVARLGDHLPAGALLVCNDTRVVPARLRARRPTGGAVEVLLVEMEGADEESCRWSALARANKPLSPGDLLAFEGGPAAVVEERRHRGEVLLRVGATARAMDDHMKAHGEVPLPPYIRRRPVAADRDRYQTVYAAHDGSVAAPTAGLHFTPRLLAELAGRGVEVRFVTLHVGPGTFRPVASEELSGHVMHKERYSIGAETARAIRAAREQGRPVVAVGTTVVRALEGCHAAKGRLEETIGETDIFISPPFEFRVIDGLMTNFHLPRSTLLCLVSALAGRTRILAAYREAIEMRYRFYSYGDAMLILPEGR